MSDNTSISWTDASWNPVTGCSRVSSGCANCYAETLSTRFGWTSKPWSAQNAAENVRLHPERLDQPLRWKRPRKIFVNSMSDLFHEQVPFSFVAAVFGVMVAAPHHRFQVLTKRPARMLEFFQYLDALTKQITNVFPRDSKEWRRGHLIRAAAHNRGVNPRFLNEHWPLTNVWLGVSVENQRAADERIPLLLQAPAAVKFVSLEPLLGPVNLDLPRCETHDREHVAFNPDIADECCTECAANGWSGELTSGMWLDPLNDGVSWVIVGGESGPNHRPMDLDWARSIRDQCREAGVAFYFKQESGLRPGTNATLDGVEWHQFPGEASEHE